MPPKFKRHLNDDDVTGSVKSERVSAWWPVVALATFVSALFLALLVYLTALCLLEV